jgi:hypothetical protein
MNRNLLSWLLVVVICLGFTASNSHADILAIRCILGLSDDTISTQTRVAQFAIDKPLDAHTPRPFAADEIVGNFADGSVVLLPPAMDEVLNPSPLPENLVILLVVGAGDQNASGRAIVQAVLPQAVDGLPKGITTIVLEVKVPASPPQIQRQKAANNVFQLITPEPASFQGTLEPVSSRGNPQSMEIARKRGPVK